ncbi:MAG: DedA family protein [Nitrospirota bacterium]|jgi:membrane protein DedA with SNARE-associated domain
MDQLQAYLVDYGLWVLFIGTVLEGEVVLVLAGFLAHVGLFPYWQVVAVAVSGGVLGDQIFFYLGRWKGEVIVHRVRVFSRRAGKAMELIDHWHGWLIPASRFLYGFRILLPLTFGMIGTPPTRFAILNVASAIPWALLFSFTGYALGEFALEMIQTAQRHRGIALLAVMVVAGLVGAVLAFQVAKAPKPTPPE